MQQLPELCQLRFKWGYQSRQFAKWKKLLGPESVHIHHYCEGLVDLQRVALAPKEKQSLLNSARSNFKYVLTRIQSPNFILLPDIYYRLAIVSKEENKSSEAINFATQSIQAKKNYLNPYLLISDIYIKSGNNDEAKKILLKAKKYHPNSKILKGRLENI
ncbi:MAG: tetratricopeptide repeat protein [Methyloprofundus sp.]|nr:tetratricopeptide repeat protein [Methyloprofundus sp.]